MLHRPWRELDALLPRLAQSSAPRSTGTIHASQLYGKLYPPKKRAKPLTEQELALFAIGGFAVERVIEKGLAELLTDICPEVERPAELRVNWPGIALPIAGSPDLFFYEPDPDAPGGRNIRIGDIKCRWSSTSKLPVHEEGEDGFPRDWDKVWAQLMTYLFMLSVSMNYQYTDARLIAYFVNSDYKPPQPALHGWDISFSWQEICETWDAEMTIASETAPETA